MTMTEGQLRVGTGFNPSGLDKVDEIKAAAAGLIDAVLDLQRGHASDHHTSRWAAEAATQFETGAMFAVKALTHTSCFRREQGA